MTFPATIAGYFLQDSFFELLKPGVSMKSRLSRQRHLFENELSGPARRAFIQPLGNADGTRALTYQALHEAIQLRIGYRLLVLGQ